MARCGADEPVELARGKYNKASYLSGMKRSRWEVWEDKPTLEPNAPRLRRLYTPLQMTSREEQLRAPFNPQDRPLAQPVGAVGDVQGVGQVEPGEGQENRPVVLDAKRDRGVHGLGSFALFSDDE